MNTALSFFSCCFLTTLLASSTIPMHPPSTPTGTNTTSKKAPSLLEQGELAGSDEHETTEQVFPPNTRRNFLAKAYDHLCEAIEADDIPAARELFISYPGLVEFSYQPLGTPLHFVKSKEMAEFLIGQIGLSANVCDQWGELPSKSIFLSQKSRFASKKEQRAIVSYLKSQESLPRTIYNQLIFNRTFHMKISICGMGFILAANLISIYLSLAAKKAPALAS